MHISRQSKLRLKGAKTSNFQGLVTFNYVIKTKGQAETPKRARKSRFPHAVW